MAVLYASAASAIEMFIQILHASSIQMGGDSYQSKFDPENIQGKKQKLFPTWCLKFLSWVIQH